MSKQFFTCIFGCDITAWRRTVGALEDGDVETQPAADADADMSSGDGVIVPIPAGDATPTRHFLDAVRTSTTLVPSSWALSELTRSPGWGDMVLQQEHDRETLPFRVTATFWQNDCTNSHVWNKQKLSALHVSALALASMKAFREGYDKIMIIS